MKTVPDKYFDLAIVDPPYGIGESGKTNHTRGKLAKAKNYKPFYGNDLKPLDPIYFNELKRVSENQIIWGANHFLGWTSSCWIVWDKDNGETDFADCELAYTSFSSAVRKYKYRWQGMLQGDMKNKEDRIHPTQKPIKLYKWLLTNYAKEGQKIFDSHLGSGSIAIACHDLGFDLVGCEIDKDYYEAAVKRFNNHKLQQTLF
jgi:site-specific DNA-methyltransferase (adenine-specific)